MNPDLGLSDFVSHYLDPTSNSISPFVPSHHFPVEIWSEIFLYIVQADPHSQWSLMHVCRYWRAVLLSTPGIHSELQIRRTTEEKHVKAFIQERSRLDVTVDMHYMERGLNQFPIIPDMFYASFMAASHEASWWRSLNFVSFPPPGEYKDLEIVQPLRRLESFKLARGCDLGNSLEPLMTAMTASVTPRLTVIDVFHPDAALYLVQPAYLQIFSSLTTLRLICRKMQSPVDILPYLRKLETFEVHHLLLPIYSSNVDLPLNQTLRVLHMKAVSVQWMEGRVFPVLRECSMIFPHYADAIQSVYMPSCSILTYDSNNLGTVEHFHLSHWPDWR
jgi:hypothetical protein